MRKTTWAAAVCGVAVSLAGLVAIPAGAQPMSPQLGVCGDNKDCVYTPGEGPVRIHTQPTLGSTTVGLLQNGQTVACWAPGTCTSVRGDTVTACNYTTPFWFVVNYGGEERYVSWSCSLMGG